MKDIKDIAQMLSEMIQERTGTEIQIRLQLDGLPPEMFKETLPNVTSEEKNVFGNVWYTRKTAQVGNVELTLDSKLYNK